MLNNRDLLVYERCLNGGEVTLARLTKVVSLDKQVMYIKSLSGVIGFQ